MPRRRGGGGGMFGRKKKPAAAPTRQRRRPAVKSSVPATRPKAAPAPAQSGGGGGMGGGMMGMVAQGMAFGAGSAVAHRAIGAVADGMSGDGEEAAEQSSGGGYAAAEKEKGPCDQNQGQLYQCLNDQSGNAAACQFFFDALRDCQDNQRYAQSRQ
jgi:hypothetical protein